MIQPALSPVAPRVLSKRMGVPIPLTDEIEKLFNHSQSTSVCIDGEDKASAVQHLACVFTEQVADGRLRLEEESSTPDDSNPIVTIHTAHEARCDLMLRLAPWGRDDLIEYLLSVHPGQCASVMGRLKRARANTQFASGSPFVWRLILDRMASDETQSDIEAIVLHELRTRINSPALNRSIADRLIYPAAGDGFGVFGHFGGTNADGSDTDGSGADDISVFFSRSHSSVRQFLSHADIREAFAMERLVERLESEDIQQACLLMQGPWRWEHLSTLGRKLLDRQEIQSKLLTIFGLNQSRLTANCASLLATCKPDWRPIGKRLQLSSANLQSVAWSAIDLTDANLRRACFANADLSNSRLVDAQISGTDFSEANLRQAVFEPTLTTHQPNSEPKEKKKRTLIERMKNIGRKPKDEPVSLATSMKDLIGQVIFRPIFAGADLTGANLSRCKFNLANFQNANMENMLAQRSLFTSSSLANTNLTGADFSGCYFVEVDLSNARLDRCKFVRTSFMEAADFEDICATEIDFTEAKLNRSLWTGSKLSSCNFGKVDLMGARLAEIEWNGCDLRGADMRGCTFHMGSTRCGLVGSPYPSHGTRTGFYTDDYDDQHFKSPESIRKASLVNSDLRGANITNVDFYLVDLRGTKFDASQKAQLVATGAILDANPF